MGMDEEEEKGKQKGGRRRDKHEQSTRAWSMENTQAYWHIGRIQELTVRQNVQRRLGRLGRSLGPGFEYQKILGQEMT